MLFSLSWLMELCPVDRDARVVADALTSRGLTVDAADALGADHRLDIDVPANRPDCLGHLGVARELGAAFGVPLAEPPDAPAEEGAAVHETARVEIDDDELCPRYTARLVRGVRVAPSPEWVVRRLECCGLRSVNNVVDASNLVLLALAHPIHFFDLARISDETDASRPMIRVRRARPAESMVTLDGVARDLDAEMLTIADGRQAVALAGIIGAANSEIHDATRDVLIEAAMFQPRSIRATSRRLGIQTDASYRFERGVDPEGLVAAQELAVRLLVELAGGRAAPGLIDIDPRRREARRLGLRVAQLERLLGFAPPVDDVVRALRALGLAPLDPVDGRIEVTPPSWRVDLEREADLVEEVARHVGYDGIPTVSAQIVPSEDEEPGRALERRARDLLAQGGFSEAVGYAMIGPGEDDAFVDEAAPAAIPLSNPIAETLSRLRRSMLPGLLRALELNVRRGTGDVRLFEVGRVFAARQPGEFPGEPRRIGVAWTGAAQARHWSSDARDVDLFDLMGIVEHVLRSMRPGLKTRRDAEGPRAFHPGRRARWSSLSGSFVAWGGALSPALQREVDVPTYMAEIDLDALAAETDSPARHATLPRFPSVARDLALVLTPDVSYSTVLAVLDEIDSPAPVRFDAVDRYQGPPLAAGESSLTVRFTLQPNDRTLTDAETEAYRCSLIEALQTGLSLRLRS